MISTRFLPSCVPSILKEEIKYRKIIFDLIKSRESTCGKQENLLLDPWIFYSVYSGKLHHHTFFRVGIR